MQRSLGVAVILLLCMYSLMPRVKGCNPSLRPSRDSKNACVATVCSKGGTCGFPCHCVGNTNPWCNGYCTK
uniref:Putative secreted protein n=1 Tax=Amblyomma americanum TaxID=6943 RepID=A0A0C9S375_AMBAM